MMAVLPTAALADDAAAALADDEWEFIAAPYGWGIGLAGDIHAEGNRIGLDLNLRRILDTLEFAAFAEFTARKGPWYVEFDGWGAILSVPVDSDVKAIGFGPTTIQEGALTISIPQVQTAVGPIKTDTRLNLIMLELGGGYRILSEPLGENSERLLNLELYAGGRLWRLHTKTDISLAPVTIPGFDIGASVTPPRFPNRPIDLGGVEVPGLTTAGLDETVEATSWWIDPVVGIRVSADLTDRVAIRFLGNVGGLGIGTASEFTWELESTLAYQLGESWTLRLGYRAIHIKRPHDGFAGNIYGPVFAAVFRWGVGGG